MIYLDLKQTLRGRNTCKDIRHILFLFLATIVYTIIITPILLDSLLKCPKQYKIQMIIFHHKISDSFSTIKLNIEWVIKTLFKVSWTMQNLDDDFPL